MKPPLPLLLLALLAAACAGCGAGASGGTATSARIVRGLGPSGHEDADGDHDFKPLDGDYAHVAEAQDRLAALAIATGAGGTLEVEQRQSGVLDADADDDNHQAILAYGHPAGAADQRAIALAVTRYYAVAASGGSTRACALLLPSLAASVAREYGTTRYLRGRSCPEVESRLFARTHAELLADHRTLEVLRARVHGDIAVALLAWKASSREGQIALQRERGHWRLAGLIDGPRPLDGEAH